MYRLVRRQLANGELKPGDRILETQVARAAGVSRSPVREAFSRLEEDGLVASKPHRGTYVMPLGAERFREIAEFRLGLEELAVRRLSTFADGEDLRELTVHSIINYDALAASEFDAFVRADIVFHRSLIERASNEPLLGAYMWLAKEFESYSRLMVGDDESIALLAREHEELISCIRDRQSDRAVALLRVHLLRGFDLALTRLS